MIRNMKKLFFSWRNVKDDGETWERLESNIETKAVDLQEAINYTWDLFYKSMLFDTQEHKERGKILCAQEAKVYVFFSRYPASKKESIEMIKTYIRILKYLYKRNDSNRIADIRNSINELSIIVESRKALYI